MSENLRIERQGRVLRLTLDRPDKRNALNLALCRDLVSAMQEGLSDDAIGAILLASEGKSFCAGMDLSEMLNPEARPASRIHEQLFTLGARMTKPVVAAVQGAALAGGMGLVANAHVAVAAEDATFGLTEIRIGLWPFVVFRAVVAAVGERHAVELALSGRTFDAGEAVSFGLVHQVVAADQLDQCSFEIADALANSSPEAVRSGLLFVAETRNLDWKRAGEIAWRFRERLFRSADFAEGLRAFQEKRKPRW